jgi:hypothetical protein
VSAVYLNGARLTAESGGLMRGITPGACVNVYLREKVLGATVQREDRDKTMMSFAALLLKFSHR